MERELLTLWIVSASNAKMAALTYVYARDEAHARQLAQEWLEKRPTFPEHTFQAYPSGFCIVHRTLPGTIVDENTHEEGSLGSRDKDEGTTTL